MIIIPAEVVHNSLTFADLIQTLQLTFSKPFSMPQRKVYELDENSSSHDAFAVLPSWNDETIAVKAFTYLPDNPKQSADLKSIYAQIMIFDRSTGLPQAVVDGTSATYWRTAAVSALACDYLARSDASTLLICGTGNLAAYMALAHASVRNIKEIKVWGRSSNKIQHVVDEILQKRPDIIVSESQSLEDDVPWADIISCATRSPVPLFSSSLVTEGTHVDLVGNHVKTCREVDTQLVVRSEVYVDAKVNTFSEAGELLMPVKEGAFNLDEVKGELSQLCKGDVYGRDNDKDITLFKSVGTALADLACAQLVYQKTL
ncbi:ornithine cyclodeaminase family protein [Parashewanella spongiae]|uniref:Ornithine cyclodeaminase family protein n=1 Tax=Parashewanella spongiae TaxID=342950 RepID=A0A3A6TQD4_9GAMM|nr:ornithine cyclodeaminase family protein [Parashewanella spongiae]MCL1078111.1 ornithine cyclodeaminase family protein [Parashewanella spongiae]RJY16357.1 ornithine cyclodeaminase family protein [Parashewanella spongiae]